MKNSLLALIASSCIMIMSCKKDNESLQKGCCGEPAIEMDFGNAHVYLPNIFTPDNDGINDLLTVYGDSVSSLISLIIKNSSGVTVFEVNNLPFPSDQANWDGSTEGFIIPGLYEISAILKSDDGVIQNLGGHVCNFPCGNSSVPFIEDITGCQFPVQWNGAFNPLIPSGEEPSCFE